MKGLAKENDEDEDSFLGAKNQQRGAEEADAWLEAGCFRAEDASQETKEGIGNYEASLAYKFANNDLSLQDVLEFLGRN